MGPWDYLNNNGFGLFICFIVGCVTLVKICNLPVTAYRLRLRAANISAHGWPPQPLDADGDVHLPSCNCQDDSEDDSRKAA